MGLPAAWGEARDSYSTAAYTAVDSEQVDIELPNIFYGLDVSPG